MRAARPARPGRRPGCFSRARVVGVPVRRVLLLRAPAIPARAPRRQDPRGSVAPKVTLRRRTDLGGPGSLEIQPPCVPALGDLGFEPRPGEKGCARTSLTPACLPLGVASVAVCVTCRHLPILPLNLAPVNFVFLSTLYPSSPSRSS